MPRPRFPTGMILPVEAIRRINYDQETYDRDPEEWERREREDRERREEEEQLEQEERRAAEEGI